MLLLLSLVFAPLQGALAAFAMMPAGHAAAIQDESSDRCAGHVAKDKIQDCCKTHQSACGINGSDCPGHCAVTLVFMMPQVLHLAVVHSRHHVYQDIAVHPRGFRPDLEHRPPITA